ncbi:Mucin-like domain [Trinorchestia longiramus]|nr:Mucin-like domain [Trinorchestia longiramus]
MGRRAKSSRYFILALLVVFPLVFGGKPPPLKRVHRARRGAEPVVLVEAEGGRRASLEHHDAGLQYQLADGKGGYEFGYDTRGTAGGAKHFRHEKKDDDGSVRGHYGFVDANGHLHIIGYVTDANGKRIHTESHKIENYGENLDDLLGSSDGSEDSSSVTSNIQKLINERSENRAVIQRRVGRPARASLASILASYRDKKDQNHPKKTSNGDKEKRKEKEKNFSPVGDGPEPYFEDYEEDETNSEEPDSLSVGKDSSSGNFRTALFELDKSNFLDRSNQGSRTGIVSPPGPAVGIQRSPIFVSLNHSPLNTSPSTPSNQPSEKNSLTSPVPALFPNIPNLDLSPKSTPKTTTSAPFTLESAFPGIFASNENDTVNEILSSEDGNQSSDRKGRSEPIISFTTPKSIRFETSTSPSLFPNIPPVDFSSGEGTARNIFHEPGTFGSGSVTFSNANSNTNNNHLDGTQLHANKNHVQSNSFSNSNFNSEGNNLILNNGNSNNGFGNNNVNRNHQNIRTYKSPQDFNSQNSIGFQISSQGNNFINTQNGFSNSVNSVSGFSSESNSGVGAFSTDHKNGNQFIADSNGNAFIVPTHNVQSTNVHSDNTNNNNFGSSSFNNNDNKGHVTNNGHNSNAISSAGFGNGQFLSPGITIIESGNNHNDINNNNNNNIIGQHFTSSLATSAPTITGNNFGNNQNVWNNNQGSNSQNILNNNQGSNSQNILSNNQGNNNQNIVHNNQGNNNQNVLHNNQGNNNQNILHNNQGNNNQNVLHNNQGNNNQNILHNNQGNINQNSLHNNQVNNQNILSNNQGRNIRNILHNNQGNSNQNSLHNNQNNNNHNNFGRTQSSNNFVNNQNIGSSSGNFVDQHNTLQLQSNDNQNNFGISLGTGSISGPSVLSNNNFGNSQNLKSSVNNGFNNANSNLISSQNEQTSSTVSSGPIISVTTSSPRNFGQNSLFVAQNNGQNILSSNGNSNFITNQQGQLIRSDLNGNSIANIVTSFNGQNIPAITLGNQPVIIKRPSIILSQDPIFPQNQNNHIIRANTFNGNGQSHILLSNGAIVTASQNGNQIQFGNNNIHSVGNPVTQLDNGNSNNAGIQVTTDGANTFRHIQGLGISHTTANPVSFNGGNGLNFNNNGGSFITTSPPGFSFNSQVTGSNSLGIGFSTPSNVNQGFQGVTTSSYSTVENQQPTSPSSYSISPGPTTPQGFFPDGFASFGSAGTTPNPFNGNSSPGSTPSSAYGTPSIGTPSSEYGTPSVSTPSTEYGTPSLSTPSSEYGTPSINTPSQFGTPVTSPSTTFGLPNVSPSQDYGPPVTQPSGGYGLPEIPSSEYGTPDTPSSEYGLPSTPSTEYGAPDAPSTEYGLPTTPSEEYGTPVNTPISSYGTPVSSQENSNLGSLGSTVASSFSSFRSTTTAPNASKVAPVSLTPKPVSFRAPTRRNRIRPVTVPSFRPGPTVTAIAYSNDPTQNGNRGRDSLFPDIGEDLSITALGPHRSPVFINSTVYVSTTPLPEILNAIGLVPRLRTPSSLPPFTPSRSGFTSTISPFPTSLFPTTLSPRRTTAHSLSQTRATPSRRLRNGVTDSSKEKPPRRPNSRRRRPQSHPRPDQSLSTPTRPKPTPPSPFFGSSTPFSHLPPFFQTTPFPGSTEQGRFPPSKLDQNKLPSRKFPPPFIHHLHSPNRGRRKPIISSSDVSSYSTTASPSTRDDGPALTSSYSSLENGRSRSNLPKRERARTNLSLEIGTRSMFLEGMIFLKIFLLQDRLKNQRDVEGRKNSEKQVIQYSMDVISTQTV